MHILIRLWYCKEKKIEIGEVLLLFTEDLRNRYLIIVFLIHLLQKELLSVRELVMHYQAEERLLS